MLSVLLLSLAAQGSPVPAADSAVSKPKKERLICRPIESTGTRMGPGRECRTATEWNALGGNISQRDLDRVTQQNGR
jgi:hypothetical protein